MDEIYPVGPEGSRKAIVGDGESDTGDFDGEDIMDAVQTFNLVACHEVFHGCVDYEVTILHPYGRIDPCKHRTICDTKEACEESSEGCLPSVLQACVCDQEAVGDDQKLADDQQKVLPNETIVAEVTRAEESLEDDDVEDKVTLVNVANVPGNDGDEEETIRRLYQRRSTSENQAVIIDAGGECALEIYDSAAIAQAGDSKEGFQV